jgi:hypothetical protein
MRKVCARRENQYLNSLVPIFDIGTMPNWCWNQLRVIGPAENIADMLEHNLDFQHYVPCDPDCDAQSEAWGTKWTHQDYQVLYKGEFDMKVEFRTAWAPPIAFLEKLNARLPGLEEGGKIPPSSRPGQVLDLLRERDFPSP